MNRSDAIRRLREKHNIERTEAWMRANTGEGRLFPARYRVTERGVTEYDISEREVDDAAGRIPKRATYMTAARRALVGTQGAGTLFHGEEK